MRNKGERQERPQMEWGIRVINRICFRSLVHAFDPDPERIPWMAPEYLEQVRFFACLHLSQLD